MESAQSLTMLSQTPHLQSYQSLELCYHTQLAKDTKGTFRNADSTAPKCPLGVFLGLVELPRCLPSISMTLCHSQSVGHPHTHPTHQRQKHSHGPQPFMGRGAPPHPPNPTNRSTNLRCLDRAVQPAEASCRGKNFLDQEGANHISLQEEISHESYLSSIPNDAFHDIFSSRAFPSSDDVKMLSKRF